MQMFLVKQITNIKRDEIYITNSVNDDPFNLHNSLYNYNNTYMEFTLKSKILRVAT